MAQVDKSLKDPFMPSAGVNLDYIYDPVGSVTSRDQIIDPYALVDINNYRKTRAGKAQYAADLAQAQRYAEMQEAAYQEWYNSPEQQVIRDREAGLNPDISESPGSQAADVQMQQTNPMEGIMTNGEVATQAVSGIASLVSSLSSVASLATAFMNVPNIQKQSELLGLDITDKLSQLMSSDISSLLGTAMDAHRRSTVETPFDLNAWFNDDNNFVSLADVYGSHTNYKAALALARKKGLKYHTDALAMQGAAADSSLSLAQDLANPMYSDDLKLSIIHFRPLMEAEMKQRAAVARFQTSINTFNADLQDGMDVQKAIDSANAAFDSSLAKSNYEADYFNASDGKFVADFEAFMREVQQAGATMEKMINDGYIQMYNQDPNGEAGMKATLLYSNRGSLSMTDYYYLNAYEDFVQMVEADQSIKSAIANNAELREKLISIVPLLNYASSTPIKVGPLNFRNPGLHSYSGFGNQIISFINSLESFAEYEE